MWLEQTASPFSTSYLNNRLCHSSATQLEPIN
jgi:hypothetical protein